MNRSHIFKIIIMVFTILILLAGLILGYVFRTHQLKDYYRGTSSERIKDYMYENKFNYPIMLICYGSGVVFITFFSLLNSILVTLEEIRNSITKKEKVKKK